MNLKEETQDYISKTIEKIFGISYEEFEQLDFEEQQKLITMYKKKIKRKNPKQVTTMIGSEENSIFMKVKNGKRIMVASGENSCFVRKGISPEEARQELNNKIDDALYSKPVAFVKKLQRRISNK